ncbi:riboflavin synthase [Prochlorococcus sp. MIT 1300]|uniref:riboflavin synthase n=1 Tax=Prochlorococcus sp. MIT 1300 TaxID=3096218 RepID=UPI002A75D876|nr:riboflavin synthase [Prochlorococcus sp. MIT 1300]
MFTGLVQGIGKIRRRSRGLLIENCESLGPLTLGDSIAVDGVCLTVAEIVPNGFLADVSEETLRRTTLGLKADALACVNLEPALRLSDRMGGHIVSGHIDGLGKVVEIVSNPQSVHLEVMWQESSYGRYVCDKASICLNGISLTVAASISNGSRFSIAVIPHTWTNTSLKVLKEGDLVNLEADLMAKYAESLLSAMFEETNIKSSAHPLISKEWLANQGWV